MGWEVSMFCCCIASFTSHCQFEATALWLRLPPLCRLQVNTAHRLSSSLMPSLSCRHIKTTNSQTWSKPSSELQLPGGLFYSGFQPTMEYQEMSKCTSLWRRVPEENSMSSECLRCQGHRGMIITFWSGRDLCWWCFVSDTTDWTVISIASWSWHPRQTAPMIKKTKPQSMFYKDDRWELPVFCLTGAGNQ